METATQVIERRTGTQRFIEHMLAERQEMWVLYCKVAGLKPYQEKNAVGQNLDRFCQILIDYISTGHFGLYERIAQGKERRRRVCDIAANVYDDIAQCTDAAVKFNDTYEPTDEADYGEAFASDLSRLGEALATRIELEDRIIAEMT